MRLRHRAQGPSARLLSLRRRLRFRRHDHDVVLVRSIELRTRRFVEYVGVHRFAANERDAPLPLQTLHLQKVALIALFIELLLIFLAGLQAAVAVQALPDEVAGQKRGEPVQPERQGEGTHEGGEAVHAAEPTGGMV